MVYFAFSFNSFSYLPVAGTDINRSEGFWNLEAKGLVNHRKISNLAPPNGLARGAFDVGGVGPILGEESGLGDTEALPDRGKSSSFFRASCGVGGVELLAYK